MERTKKYQTDKKTLTRHPISEVKQKPYTIHNLDITVNYCGSHPYDPYDDGVANGKAGDFKWSASYYKDHNLWRVYLPISKSISRDESKHIVFQIEQHLLTNYRGKPKTRKTVKNEITRTRIIK